MVPVDLHRVSCTRTLSKHVRLQLVPVCALSQMRSSMSQNWCPSVPPAQPYVHVIECHAGAPEALAAAQAPRRFAMTVKSHCVHARPIADGSIDSSFTADPCAIEGSSRPRVGRGRNCGERKSTKDEIIPAWMMV